MRGKVEGKAEGVTRASPAPADPLAELARIDSEDALVRWAIAAMPYRSGLDDEPRTALDRAFQARADTIGASPDLILAFAENVPTGDGLPPTTPLDSGDDHAPHAPR